MSYEEVPGVDNQDFLKISLKDSLNSFELTTFATPKKLCGRRGGLFVCFVLLCLFFCFLVWFVCVCVSVFSVLIAKKKQVLLLLARLAWTMAMSLTSC